MLRLILFVLVSMGVLPAKGQTARPPSPGAPNVIIILVDDLGYQDVGFNGCPDIPTPHIDRIAAEGVRFTNAYVSYAVCGPSRAGLITGRYQDRFGFGRNPLFAPNDPGMGLPQSEETLAEVLHRADYRSIAIGKWHLGAHPSLRPLKRGFDDFFGFLSGGHSYLPELWTLPDEYAVRKQYDAYNTKLLRNDTRVEEQEYLTDALSREAVHYIERYQDQPFFMYLAYNAPHGPLQATDKYLSRFTSIEDPKRRTYAAMVSAVDDGVGALLDKLEELDLAENTLVFFLSDNGGPERHNASNNGILRGGKSELYEGGVRVPFALRWPGRVPVGMVYDQPVISLDIFATAIARAHQPLTTQNPLDGVDLLPYLAGDRTGAPHAFLFWRKFDARQHAVRNAGGAKFIAFPDSVNVFDLATDIREENASLPGDNAAYRELRNAYDTWQSQLLAPTFLGLLSDKRYSQKHPDRFKRPE